MEDKEHVEEGFPEFGKKLRHSDFVLDHGYTFINHGYVGVVPKPVIATHQRFIDEMRSQPTAFFKRKKLLFWTKSRDAAAKYLNANPDDTILVPNVTTGVKSKSIAFKLPINSEDDILDLYRTALDREPSIRVVVIDYICSISGMMIPVAKILQLCRKYNVITIVDGAHAAGQIPLSLDTMDVDFFIGSFYKWMFCPWGAAFIWKNRKFQLRLVPLASYSSREDDLDSQFCMQGTHDDTCYYSIPTAIEYIESKGGISKITKYNTRLLEMASCYLVTLWNTNKLQIPESMEAPFLRTIRLPKLQNYGTSQNDAVRLMNFMYEELDTDVSIKAIDDDLYVRLSVQIYNCMDDYVTFGKAVMALSDAQCHFTLDRDEIQN